MSVPGAVRPDPVLINRERPEQPGLLIAAQVVTTNREDPVTAAAIDRLVHHAVILEMTGTSIRVEHAHSERAAQGDGRCSCRSWEYVLDVSHGPCGLHTIVGSPLCAVLERVRSPSSPTRAQRSCARCLRCQLAIEALSVP